jgi:hypothetical protein
MTSKITLYIHTASAVYTNTLYLIRHQLVHVKIAGINVHTSN